MAYFLTGDLGGTKALLALYRLTAQGCELVRERRFAVSAYPGFSPIVADFLSTGKEQPQLAVFGVAGPVLHGRAQLTGPGWPVDEDSLRQEFNFTRVVLLNDLLALASALPALPPGDLRVVNSGRPSAKGTMAVLAPGTGLGEAFLCWNGEEYAAFPSEGGHADFAPATELEDGLLVFLRAKLGHVSYERVCSGAAIPEIYLYLTEVMGLHSPRGFRDELAGAVDQTPLIIAQATSKEGVAARSALDLFFSILAAEAGNAALKFMATGGLYLGGGLLVRLLPFFSEEKFMSRFMSKGRMSALLADMPIRIVTTERAALMGAVRLARQATQPGETKAP